MVMGLSHKKMKVKVFRNIIIVMIMWAKRLSKALIRPTFVLGSTIDSCDNHQSNSVEQTNYLTLLHQLTLTVYTKKSFKFILIL